MSPKAIMTLLAPFYIAIGPVYWFIFVSPGVFNAIKYLIAITLIGSTLFFGANQWLKDRRFFTDSGVKLIVLIIFLSIPGMFFSQSEHSLEVLVRYFILMGLLIAFYWVTMEPKVLQRLPVAISIVMIPLCLITIGDWLGGIGLRSFDGSQRLHAVGFSTTRTGWSSGLACMSVFMVWRFLETSSKGKYVFIFCALLLMLSQLSSGGRGGLLGSVLGSLALLVYYRKFAVIMMGATMAVVFVIVMQDELRTHLRIDRIGDSSQKVDFTSGRAEQYGLAFDLIETPRELFFGLGPKGYEAEFKRIGIGFEIHNVWLRLFVEYGVLLPVCILGFIVNSVLAYLRKNKKVTGAAGPVIILMAGMIPTVVEPNAIVFSYQNYLLWWWLFIAMKMNVCTRGEVK